MGQGDPQRRGRCPDRRAGRDEHATAEAGAKDESPEDGLGRLFEFEYCAECGGDAADHEVCLVPGIGNYFARCKRTIRDAETDGEPQNEGDRA